MSNDKKVILVGMDALLFPLMKKFVSEGIMPNFEKMMKEGCSCEALPNIPAWTPTASWIGSLPRWMGSSSSLSSAACP